MNEADPWEELGDARFVYLFEGRDERFSSVRVRPQDLELIPDTDPEALAMNQAIVDALPDRWLRTLRPKRPKQSNE